MNLPKEFIEKYDALLGIEAAAFFATFDEAAVSAFRVNPLKKLHDFSDYEKIADSKFGYYGKISGKSAEFLTGVVYSQEPAAQMVVEFADIQEGQRVLDLCAAPGGKSTHILSYLGDSGVLVSNEISGKRAKILVENLERTGSRNAVVLNESPERLTAVFADYFDRIVVDAPCSGEGMFRKDPDAMRYWSQDYVKECSLRQQEILSAAMTMLAPGGKLIYSTCTWSPEEDEEIVDWLTENFETLSVVSQQKFWPHEFRGEGQFVAVLEDKRMTNRKTVKSGKSNLSAEQQKLWSIFAADSLKIELTGSLQVFGDALYLLPEGLPDLSNLKIARNGLHLGTFKKNRFEPSLALGLTLTESEVQKSLALTESEFEKYVRGEALQLTESAAAGWTQLTVAGNGLDFAKISQQTIKNHYPKGLRLQ